LSTLAHKQQYCALSTVLMVRLQKCYRSTFTAALQEWIKLYHSDLSHVSVSAVTVVSLPLQRDTANTITQQTCIKHSRHNHGHDLQKILGQTQDKVRFRYILQVACDLQRILW